MMTTECPLIDGGRMKFLEGQLRFAEASLKAARRGLDAEEVEEAQAWVDDCKGSMRQGRLSPLLEGLYAERGDEGTVGY